MQDGRPRGFQSQCRRAVSTASTVLLSDGRGRQRSAGARGRHSGGEDSPGDVVRDTVARRGHVWKVAAMMCLVRSPPRPVMLVGGLL
ncbi:hypothetical protein MRB53_042276 [Persea americana]|nr:hypothetical protein MRB53_042276 [Persea americana]